MRRRKVLALFISAVTVASLLLTGCQSGNEKLESGEGESGGEKTKLVFLRGGTEPEKKAYWEAAIEAFEKENPDIEVEYQETPNGDDMETKLNTGFASGTAPDIINFTMASMGTRVPLGQYACLDEYVDQWDGKEDMLDNALTLGTLGGKLYGVGLTADPKILMWNKELFKDAGLDPEVAPKNWEELLDYHKKLTVKNDAGEVTQVGFGMPTTGTFLNHYLSIFIEQNGVKNLVDEDTNEVLLNTPEAIEAGEFMKEIADVGLIPWDADKGDQNPFLMGLSAITIGNETDYKNFCESGLDGKIGIAEPIENKKPATFCGMQFLFMSGETKHPEEAWKFIEFMSSAEQMWDRYEQWGSAPLRESLQEKYLAAAGDLGEAVYKSIENGTGSPKVTYANSVYNYAAEAVEKIFFNVLDVESALNEAAEKIQDEIDSQ